MVEILENLKKCFEIKGSDWLFATRLQCLVAALDLVMEDENAIVFALIESNRPDKYNRSDKSPHISLNISDIIHCEKADGAPPFA